MSRERVLVTGAAGFIGSHLVRRLVERGVEVHAVLRPTTRPDRLAALADTITIHRLDLGDSAALAACLAEVAPQAVYHLAAETRSTTQPSFAAARATMLDNQLPLIALVETLSALPQPPRVVVRAGTIAEYGASPLPFREDAREAPVTPYGAGMLAGTHYLAMLQDAIPFPIMTARLALVYGEGQSEGFLIPRLIRASLEGRVTRIDRPDDTRDLLYVEDAVAGLLALAERPLSGARAINIGTGVAPTMREVVQMVLEATGADPALAQFGEGKSRPGIADLLTDTTLAADAIGWRAATPLAAGIALTVSALKRTNAA